MARTRGGSARGTRSIGGVHPGPRVDTVLTLQSTHRSEDVWEDVFEDVVLFCRHHKLWPLHDSLRPIIRRAGFLGVSQIGHIALDHPLLTALVERWREETHTFHMTIGEMTVTLQDVAVLMGLRIDGLPVTGPVTCMHPWDEFIFYLLGVRPTSRDISRTSLRLSWLRRHFFVLPAEALDDPVQLDYHAQAYILGIFGSILFPDSSGDTVPLMFLHLLADLDAVDTYSWGSASLAWLYRYLCRSSRSGVSQIGGNLLLLQLWTWERFPIGRPFTSIDLAAPYFDEDILPPLGACWTVLRTSEDPQNPYTFPYYRQEFDELTDDQVVWTPYTYERLSRISPDCTRDIMFFMARVPLICFAYVEWYFPDRVCRQFSLGQHIPEPCDTDRALHTYDRRGRHDTDWIETHQQYIDLWSHRHSSVYVGPGPNPAYMEWYRSITRLQIAPPTAPVDPVHIVEARGRARVGVRASRPPADADITVYDRGIRSIARRCRDVIRDAAQAAVHAFAADILRSCRSTLDAVGGDDTQPRPSIDVGRRGRSRDRSRSRSHSQHATQPTPKQHDFEAGPSSAPEPSTRKRTR